jgi:hypothetical protein
MAVLKFFVPGHLDGFELPFVRKLGITGKTGELGNPLMKISEADGERVEIWKFLDELNANFLSVVPIECIRHSPAVSPFRCLSL